MRSTLPASLQTGTTPRGALFRGFRLAEAASRHCRDERLPIGHLIVPGQRDAAHQVRVRRDQALVFPKSEREPVDATLAADTRHVHRVGVLGHEGIVAPRHRLAVPPSGSRALLAIRLKRPVDTLESTTTDTASPEDELAAESLETLRSSDLELLV